MKRRFTPKAEHALRAAAVIAGEMGHTYIGSEHLLLALAEETDSMAASFLESHAADGGKLRRATAEATGAGTPTKPSPEDMTHTLRRVVETSAALPRKAGAPIGTEQLLLALLRETDAVGVRLLSTLGVNVAELRSEVEELTRENERATREGTGFSLSALPYLGQYGRDLNLQAEEGRTDPLIGREEELFHTMRILCRRQKNNPCLIGEPGVGKTAIAEGLAARIAEGRVPAALQHRRVVALDLSAMLAGAKYRGEFEDRMRGVLEETRQNPALILFIDELHTIVGAGAAEGAIDAANILKPALARGEVRLIGATTVREYRLHIERDAALGRRFEQVPVEEPSAEEAVRMLEGLSEKYGAHHRVTIEAAAIRAAVRLSVRYLPDRFLPDKALDLLDEAAAEVRMQYDQTPSEAEQGRLRLAHLCEEKMAAIRAQRFEAAAALRDEERALMLALRNTREEELPRVTAEQVAKTLARRVGMPPEQMHGGEGETPEEMAARLRAHIVGQDAAIDAVVRAVCRRRTGVGDPRRPVGCFLFLGPSGVGKTALARALAVCLYGGEGALCQLDMSECMERHSVSRLIGAPPGYIGHEEGGALVERLRRRPYSVILFDEIEKAHPDVANLLLQMMEEGRLTDTLGRTADLSHAIIVLTSNADSERYERHPLGFRGEAADTRAEGRQALRASFRPELLNRLDEIIRFRPLGKRELSQVARRMLREVDARLKEGGGGLSVTEEAIEALTALCHPDEHGARELRRIIEREVEGAISSALLSGRRAAGDPFVITLKEGRLCLDEGK